MTTQMINPDAFLMGGGSQSAKFETIGTTVTGTIAEAPEVRQQTDPTDNSLKFWKDGSPQMQLVVTLQTNQRNDSEDDGKRRLFIKGKSLTEAVREAVKKTGAKGLEIGGTLTVTYTGDGPQPNRALSAPKLYTATYARPDTTTQSGEFLGVAPQPAVQPAPVAAPAASGPSPEQVAALRAAGLDPKAVFPNYSG